MYAIDNAVNLQSENLFFVLLFFSGKLKKNYITNLLCKEQIICQMGPTLGRSWLSIALIFPDSISNCFNVGAMTAMSLRCCTHSGRYRNDAGPIWNAIRVEPEKTESHSIMEIIPKHL